MAALLHIGLQAGLRGVVASRQRARARLADQGEPELRVLAEAVAADGAGKFELALVDQAVAVVVGFGEHCGEYAWLQHVAGHLCKALGCQKIHNAILR